MEEIKKDSTKNKHRYIIWVLLGLTMVLNGLISYFYDNLLFFIWFLISLFGAFIFGIAAKECWPEIFKIYKNKDE